MKYPEEAIKIARTLDVLEYGEVQDVIAYAQWAHEQLRPRWGLEESPEEGQWILRFDYFHGKKEGEWLLRQYKKPGKLAHYWLPEPPPPEEPDPMETVWADFCETHAGMPSSVSGKLEFKAGWQAALKWKEGK